MAQTMMNSILKQSLRTFKNKNYVTEIFVNNLNKLKSILNTLTAEHVNLDSKFQQCETWEKPGKAPMTYIQIYHDDFINMAIFILKPGMKLPLHDHPSMHGLLKVISGKVKIENYSIKSDISKALEEKTNEIFDVIAEKHDDIFADETSECCILGPSERNIHEIESIDGPSAFLDVLAPPYDIYIPELGHRKCSYYNVYEEIGPNLYHLIEIPAPQWFWSDESPYCGPHLSIETGQDEEENLSNSLQKNKKNDVTPVIKSETNTDLKSDIQIQETSK